MGKGKARRRRAAAMLRAKQAGGVMPLPPPPEAVNKKRKAADDKDYMPGSLRRLLAVKEAAARKAGQSQPKQVGQAADLAAAGRVQPADAASPVDCAANAAAERSQPAGPSGREAAGGHHSTTLEQRTDSPCADAQAPAARPAPPTPAPASAQDTLEAAFGRKTLKPRKKEYLKQKKLKRKGKSRGGTAGDEEDDLEARLLQDPHKPKFGEQAQAPIKVHLKRKHWDPNAPQRTAAERCTQIYLKQMQAARQQGQQPGGGGAKRARHTKADALGGQPGAPLRQQQAAAQRRAEAGRVRAQLIEAYRQQKRQKGGEGREGAASMQTLAQLVQRDMGAADV